MSYVLGEYPVGGFPLDQSLSVADPLPGLINDPSRPRAFLLRGAPTLAGVAQTVDLSSGGGRNGSYASQSTDTPYKVFSEAIVRPYNFSVALPDGDSESTAPLSGGASLGLGEMVLGNSDGSLDTAALYDWLGAQADVYIGEPNAALTTFTKFFRGIAAGDSWDLDTLRILQRDRRFQLQRVLQQNRYMGTGACLRFDGSSDWVDYGNILNQGSTGSFTIEILCRSSTLGTSKIMVSKGVPGAAGLFMGFSSANQVYAQIQDAGSAHVAIATGAATAFLDGALRRFSMVVDRVAQQLRLFVNGDQIGSSISCSAVGSIDNTTTLRVGAFGAGGSSMLGDLDDFRFFSYARTQAEIQADMHREISAATVNLEIYTKYNEGSGSAANDETANNRDGTITGATWVGSLEGDLALAGTVKPKAYGKRRQVGVKLVDSQRLVYQVHDGSMQAIDAVRDSGDPLVFGSDLADIYSATPAAGTYNTCLAKGLFRLGSPPVGAITCDLQGDNGGSVGYAQTIGTVHRKLLTEQGGMSDPVDLDVGAYLLMEISNPAVVGFYFDEEILIDEAANQVMATGSSWWSLTRAGSVTLGRIDDPATAVPTVAFTADNIDLGVGEPYRRDPWGVRVGEVIIGYRPYHTTLTSDQVAGAVDLATRDDLGKNYRYKSARDPARSNDAKTLTVLTSLGNEDDAQAEADRLLALWMVDRDKVSLALSGGNLAYYVGTPVSLEIQQVTAAGSTISRYNTTGGKNYVVVGLTEDMGEYGAPDRLSVILMG